MQQRRRLRHPRRFFLFVVVPFIRHGTTPTEGFVPPPTLPPLLNRSRRTSSNHGLLLLRIIRPRNDDGTAVGSSRCLVRLDVQKKDGGGKQKEDEEATGGRSKRSRAGDMLRSVAGFLPFSSSDEEGKEQQAKQDEIGGGFFSGIFQGKEDDDEDTTKQQQQKQRRKEEKQRRKDEKRRLKEEKKEAKESSSSSKEESSNPISVVQKLWSDKFKNSEEWIVVFPKTQIEPGEMKPVTIAGLDLLVIASLDGRSLYCIANSCPHLGTPLETGTLTRLPVEEKRKGRSSFYMMDDDEEDDDSSKNSRGGGGGLFLSETDLTNILSQDGCEDCIVCPLHKTAFALQSGEVRGEWCPYPPVIGAVMGTVKQRTPASVFEIRTRGKNVEVRLNTDLVKDSKQKKNDIR